MAFLTSGSLASDSDLVYHLLNPRTFSWKQDLLPALSRTKLPSFDIVSPSEWLEKLKQSEQDPVKNPSIKLIDFWQRKYGGSAGATVAEQDEEAPGLTFETSQTEIDSHSVASAIDPVSAGLVERYVATWLKRWTAT